MKTQLKFGFAIAGAFFLCGFVELLCRGALTFGDDLTIGLVLVRSLISSVAFSCLWFGIALLIGRRSKIVLCPCLWFAIINTIIEVFVLIRYRRRLGGGWYSLMMNSSPDEICSFFLSNIGIVFLGVIAVFFGLLTVWVYYRMFVEDPSLRLKVVGGCFVLGAIGYSLVCYNKLSPPAYVGFIPATIQSASAFERDRFLLMSKAPSTIRLVGNIEEMPIWFFIIGESACRSHWGLYGYERDTTPMISRLQDELSVFTDMQTVYPYTEQSMRAICVAKTDSRGGVCTLAGLCKAAGYVSVLISCQGRFKNISAGDSLYFRGVDECVFLADKQHGLVYDDAIIPQVQECLKKHVGKPLVVFIHLYGSHFPFELRCPPQSRYFKSANGFVDSYDDSLRFTDSILGALHELLLKAERPAGFVYLSDHGESPDSGKTRYLVDKDCWQVPMIVWLSPLYKSQYPETVNRLARATSRPLQNNLLIPAFCELLRITGLPNSESENFLDAGFRCPPRVREFNTKSRNKNED